MFRELAILCRSSFGKGTSRRFTRVIPIKEVTWQKQTHTLVLFSSLFFFFVTKKGSDDLNYGW